MENEPGEDLVEMGECPRLMPRSCRRRMESAESPSFSGAGPTPPRGQRVLCVPATNAEFAAALVDEIEAEDEVPDTSPAAYIARIEEHLPRHGRVTGGTPKSSGKEPLNGKHLFNARAQIGQI